MITETEVAKKVTTAPTEAAALFRSFYLDSFPELARLVRTGNGTADEARDVFQEALLVYYENVLLAGKTPDDNRAYLLGIARNIWLKHCRMKQRELPRETENQPENISEQKLLRFIRRAGSQCLQLLQAVYYRKQNMKTIAAEFGFSGERSAISQKFKCLEKLRETVRQKSLQPDDFYEGN